MGFVVGQGSATVVGTAVSAGSCVAIGVGVEVDVAIGVCVGGWRVAVCVLVGEGVAVDVSVGTAVSVAGSDVPVTTTVAKGDGRGVLTGVIRAIPSEVVSVGIYFADKINNPARTTIPKAGSKNFILI